MKELNVQDAIIATMFSGGQDLPLRTVVEMTIRLYENGYRIFGPDASGSAAPIYSAWHSADDMCGGPFEGAVHQHAYRREPSADQTQVIKRPDNDQFWADKIGMTNREAAEKIAPHPFHTKSPTNSYGDVNPVCKCDDYDGHETFPYREMLRCGHDFGQVCGYRDRGVCATHP